MAFLLAHILKNEGLRIPAVRCAITGNSVIYLRKILVTTDLSEYSLAALEYAASFGLLYGARLHLLHVADEGKGDQAKRELDDFVTARISPDIKLQKSVRNGVPADAIKQFAEEEVIDLIVIATHGWTGLKHILMGSVAEKVIRQSRVPVLAVKPQQISDALLLSEDIEAELHIR